MAEGLRVDLSVVAQRCEGKKPDFAQFSPVDWVVMDFVDGKRSFGDIVDLVPASREDLTTAMIHLRFMGLLTWKTPPKLPQTNKTTALLSSIPKEKAPAKVSTANYSDEVCKKYIPLRFIPDFRKFQPELVDESLDLDVELQVFLEFMHSRLSDFEPFELLGAKNETDKAGIKNGFIQRTKIFHPDRYFKKNLGEYQPKLAAVFKAINNAFNTLSR